MKKLMILMVLALIGLTTMAQEKPKAAAGTSATILVRATIKFSLQPNGPTGDFWVETAQPVGSSDVTYTVTFTAGTGRPIGTWDFTVSALGHYSPRQLILQAYGGQAKIIAVSPEFDGVYDYTPAVGIEIDW